MTSDARIRASLADHQARKTAKQGAKVMSFHTGRLPKASTTKNSLCCRLLTTKDKLSNRFALVRYTDGVDVAEGELVVLEGVHRFNKAKERATALSKKYAALCDVFVMDAFGTRAPRAGSTHGIGKFADVACAEPAAGR